jgi:CheY-like chemotaxis protein
MTQSLPPKSLVLYADDDPDDIELITEAFRNFSQTIDLVTFESGLELLAYIDRLDPLHLTPCLVIIDINMPRLDGKQTLKMLRQYPGYEDVPVVLFSTSTLPSEALFAGSFQAGFVTKPLHAQQIHLIVSQLIEHCTDETKKQINRFRKN